MLPTEFVCLNFCSKVAKGVEVEAGEDSDEDLTEGSEEEEEEGEEEEETESGSSI